MSASDATFQVEWLDEHLAYVVPMRMWEIESRVLKMGPGLSYEERVWNIGRRDFEVVGTTNYAASTLPMLIATMGDALFGESKPGRAGDVVAALTTGLAAAALVQKGGIIYRGQHWCRAAIHHPSSPSCSCGYVKGECPTCATSVE